MMTDTISKEKFFNHPIDKVWNAITKSEEISSWFIPAIFKAEVGYKYTFNAKGGDCSAITGEILEATPYTLVYTWIVSENPSRTIVKWILEEVNGGTKLYLEHSGISNYKGENAITMFTSFNGGWDRCINDLSQYLIHEVHAR